MSERVARIGEAGRLVIPAEFRERLGLVPGSEVVLRLDDAGLHLQSRQQAIAHAQALVRRHVPAERDLVTELLADRRRESTE